jgi:tol-pal system protein YbgF
MRKRAIYGVVLPSFFSLVLLSSCVTSQRDVLNLNDQVVILNEQVGKLQRAMETKASGEGSSLGAMRERNAELVAELERIRIEVQNLSGRVEETDYLLKRVVERDSMQQGSVGAGIGDLSQRVAENESRVNQLYNYLKLDPSADLSGRQMPGPQEREPAPVVTRDPTPPPPPKSPEMELYDASLTDYKEGNYEKAIVGFKRFMDEYPKAKLSDQAQFWIGESFMALKQYEQAILAYQQVIKNFPEGGKVPGALLRQAFAFNELKDPISFKLLLEKIVKQYPNSSEAEIARTKLKTIN